MTVASKVKLTDGTEEDHKVIDTKDAAAIKNLPPKSFYPFCVIP